MKKIVIIGGGIGGLSTAYYLRSLKNKSKENIKITVVSKRRNFEFTPAFPHLAIGWRKLYQISVDLESTLKKLDINYIPQDATIIIPEKNKIILEDGKEEEYDYLVIATGPRLMMEVEGQKEYANSICTSSHALKTFQNFQSFLENPGPVVVGAIPGTSCFGPAYEFILMLSRELKKRKINIPLYFITPEPFIGHFGLGGVAESNKILSQELEENNIKYFTNKKITKVEANKVIFEDLEGNKEEIESKFVMLMPRFNGPEVVETAGDKVANPVNKMVMVNKAFQNEEYKNIYAVGVVVSIPPIEKTPIPTGVPKTGMMIEHMALAVANNIINDINNDPTRYTPELSAICVADIGDTGIGFFLSSIQKPRKTELYMKNYFLHHFKTVFEKYFLWKIKTGKITPLFEEKTINLLFKAHPIYKIEK